MAEHGAECGQCKNFSLSKPRTEYGYCMAEVVWPIIPMCYGQTWVPPERRAVWSDSNAESCHRYERKPHSTGSEER